MTIIDSETVVVYNYNELKTVLEGNNTYNLVYFGSNITLSGGININPSKTTLTIDGTYENVRYTYIDYNSSAASQTINLSSSSSMNITVQNIDITGRNYYGVICVYDYSFLSSVVISYINITYIGPQLSFAPYSSLNIIDSDIHIATNYSPANEVAETRNVTLGGTVNIKSTSTATSIFWFRNVVGGVYPYLKVLPNSNVYINADNYLYYVSSASYVNMIFGSDSTTNIEVNYGMGYVNSHETNSVLIDNNAELNITQNLQFGSNATWNIVGEFKMNSGSSLKMVSDYAGAVGNYCLRFASLSASLNLNNPNSVIFYNRPSNAIYSVFTIPYSLNVPQYNRWTTLSPIASAGDIYNIPEYSWYKIENLNNLVITGNITAITTTVLTNNLTTGEISSLPSLNNFLINNTKVLSMGRPSLSINPITDISTEISGITTLYADVRINFDGNNHYVQADNTGKYLYTYTTPLGIGTQISFVSNLSNSFLYRFRTVQIIFSGDLSILSATKQVSFSTTPFQLSPTLCNRSSLLKVVVDDSRIYPTVWNLYAFINQELTNENGVSLNDGLVFIDDIGNMTVLSSTPVLVYTSDGTTTGEIEVEWSTDEGILLQLNVVPIITNTIYKTDINWIIEAQ